MARKLSSTVPGLGAAVAGDQVVGEAPYSGRVTAVTYTPEAAITGADTNNRTVALVNKGQAGAGSTVVASLTFADDTDAVAFDEEALTLSAVAGATRVAKGDVLAWVETVAGTGLASPGGHVQVEIAAG